MLTKENIFKEELWRLISFYQRLIYLLNTFFSGDLLVNAGEINKKYLKLCNRIENILNKEGFENIRLPNWRPFENLLSLDPDAPDIDWEYGGQQLCSNFISELESLYLQYGETEFPLKKEDQLLLDELQEYLEGYKIYKKQTEDQWLKNVIKQNKEMETISESFNSEIKKQDKKYSLLYDEIITHKNIRQVSEQLFKDGYYRNAILDAFIRLESMVKEKISKLNDRELSSLTTTKLMRAVYNPSNPILRWNNLVEPWEIDEYEGYSHIFAGSMQGIRNPKAHNVFEQEPLRALRLLCLANLLAEIVDSSNLVSSRKITKR
jgi:uncharacterized protein (TIGR02391 family)